MNGKTLFTEFRPALRFLSIFVGVYLLGNVFYGLYVEFYKPAPDPATVWVSEQTAFVLNLVGGGVYSVESEGEPTVLLKNNDKTVLRIFEGCNGLNVMVVFLAFVVAFGGKPKKELLFIVAGLFVLHLSNLVRIILLYYTAIHQPHFFYYFHKYFFTAILYLVVFVLWFQWTRMKPKHDSVKA